MSDIKTSLETLFGKMESFLTTKTVVSDPIDVGGVVIVPLVEVSFGVGAGAYDTSKNEKKDANDVCGGALGAKITPSSVIVISNGNAKLINISSQFGMSKLLDIAPDILAKIPAFFNKSKDKNEDTDSEGGK